MVDELVRFAGGEVHVHDVSLPGVRPHLDLTPWKDGPPKGQGG